MNEKLRRRTEGHLHALLSIELDRGVILQDETRLRKGMETGVKSKERTMYGISSTLTAKESNERRL